MDDLRSILAAMSEAGARRFIAKWLAPNDNSKNQVYLGGDFAALSILPHGDVEMDSTERAGSKRERDKASLNFAWIDEQGLDCASEATLILYPRYPEVRFSGFLRGCIRPPTALMTSREAGRLLILGIVPGKAVLGHVVGASHAAALEVDAVRPPLLGGVFLELTAIARGSDTRAELVERLRAIHERGWITSHRLGDDGQPQPYAAPNGGGYTLEACLGVRPNGDAEPDFLGWEVKQYGVRNDASLRPKGPVTLFTPEPVGGYYRHAGPEAFVRRFGYADRTGRADRLNFGGIYRCNGESHHLTGLRLRLHGHDPLSGKITSMDGGIALETIEGEIAAWWSFRGLLTHWTRKHERAVYVPSRKRIEPLAYAFGPTAELFEGSDFLALLGAVRRGAVYYDPGIKLEAASSRPRTKRRSQFRVGHGDLADLYRTAETIRLDGPAR